ncbi:MAG TPA: hypothetical protein VF855_02210, partial [Acidimicrobiales bacterium]
MRKVALVGVVVVLLTAAVVGGWWYAHRNSTTPVSPDEAVERYERGRSSSTTSPSTSPSTEVQTTVLARLPAPGVYVYATSGSDSVDALSGASHRYPATTTITVEPADCGVTQRWLALEERWDQWTSCTDGRGILLRDFTGFHRFFGQATTEKWVCSGEARPAAANPGTTWRATCDEQGVTTVWQGTVVGAESLHVGSETVPVQRVRISLDDGLPADKQNYEAWYLEGTDLLVRQTADIETSNSTSVGTVIYREHYTIDL